jgi:hypothetical protein
MRLKSARRQSVPLTDERLQKLITGCEFFGPVFAGIEEARLCWQEHREEILALRVVSTPGKGFPHGCRPWAWWRFEQDCAMPDRQALTLDEMGELDAQERADTITLARQEWLKYSGGWAPEWAARAALVNDDELLNVWPSIWAVDRESF